MKKAILALVLMFSVLPALASAQELVSENQGLMRGKVLEVVSEEERFIPGTDISHTFQSVRIEILEGERKGEVLVIENDFLSLKEGDKFYFNYIVDVNGTEMYEVVNIDRRGALFALLACFVLAVVVFGGMQGVRSLVALGGSFLAIFYILLPGLLGGWNPLLASSLVAGAVLFAAIFFTHGFNRESAVAYGGTMIAVVLTGLFAVFATGIARLSGFSSDETVYLNFNTGGELDFAALLLGAIIIGVLGVLDDIAVTQAAVVGELYDTNPEMSRSEVYRRAVRVGKEHVGALVNTLVLAYTGASLPLLLYFYTASSNFGAIANMEIIATEIVRIIVGSIGLVLTVPVTTALAAIYLKGYKGKRVHKHAH